MIDMTKAIKEFNKYLEEYDLDDDKNQLKVVHTYGVVKIAEFIAKDLKLDNEDIELAKLIALLHDIGRFEQLKKYNNFFDNKENIDHADYGAQILFDNNLIRKFIEDDKYDNIIYKAILNHNKYKIEEGLNEKELLHAKIIRDADKTDNFRVKDLEKIETMLDISKKELANDIISEKIYADFMNSKLILLSDRKTKIDMWISYIAFIFDYNFNSGLKYLKDNNYVNKLVDRIEYKNIDTKTKMENIRKHGNEYIENRLLENKKAK